VSQAVLAAGTRPSGGLSRAASARRLAPFESDPTVIAFVQTWPGRTVLAAVFGGLLYLRLDGWTPLLWAATSAWALGGRYRQQLIAAIGLGVLMTDPFWFDRPLMRVITAKAGIALGACTNVVQLGASALFLIACCGVIVLAGRYRDSVLARRPVVCLLAVLAALILLCTSGLFHGVAIFALWLATLLLAPAIWFISYAIADRRTQSLAAAPRSALLRTFWSTSPTPLGKGWGYLSRFEATTAEQLAITQLKGVRLLAWALVLNAVLHVLTATVHGELGIPLYASVMSSTLAGGHTAWYLCWAALMSEFLENLLDMAIWGHTAIAIARFAGFRLLRNTYRPLESTTIAEFWNRYYFYFKELLVDLFFYPTFLRCFKKSQRLRLCFATFMAACVGNMAYHFTRDSFFIATIGLKQAVIGFQTYAFYCIVLTIGICVSQLRSRHRPQRTGWFRRRVTPTIGVILFFCLLHIFDDVNRDHSLVDHARFLLQLFGADQWI
jgi:hypothetical protein